MYSSLLLSCKTATMLIEKKETQPLSLSDNMKLFLHKRVCKACNAYEKQSAAIDHVLKNLFSENSESKQNTQTDSELESLKSRIKENLKK